MPAAMAEALAPRAPTATAPAPSTVRFIASLRLNRFDSLLMSILLAFFWVVVTWRTFGGMWVGRLFRDPSLSEETAMLIDSKEDVQRLITKEDVIKDLRS